MQVNEAETYNFKAVRMRTEQGEQGFMIRFNGGGEILIPEKCLASLAELIDGLME